MQDVFKTKEQLTNELAELHQRIVELEKSQTDLKKVEGKYRDIFENCIEGIYQTTPEGRFINANSSAARLLGYDSPEDLINSVTDIGTQVYAYPEDRDKAIGLLREHGAFENFEMKCRKKDGSIVWGLLNAHLVRDEQGNIICIEGTSQDITERKHMEEALRESAEKYRSLLEHAYDAIMIADLEGNLLEINKKAEELLGYTKEELIGTSISKIHPKEELARILPVFREMVAGKIHTFLDTKVLRKDGTTVPVDISGGAVRYGGREVAQAICRDITDRKKMEEHLQEYQEHLEKLVDERTNKLAMKSLKLEELNTALKVLLEQREQDKRELEDKVLFNVRKLALPYIDSLKQRQLDEEQRTYLDVLEANLNNIVSPFAKKLTATHENLTPQEIKVADFIRNGKTVKEIAAALGVSESTINFHRQSIRNKLGLTNQTMNLRTYLLSVT